MQNALHFPKPRVLAIAMFACVAVVAILPSQSQAAQESIAKAQAFDIPASSLASALTAFGLQSGLQLSYSSALVKGMSVPSVKGTLTPSDVLATLLKGTQLEYRLVNGTTVVIVQRDESATRGSSDARLLGPVRVEGAEATRIHGVNGSNDPTATEGTGSYTSGALSIASKMPQSIKETPQSVSVITQERMQDQNLNDFTTVLNQATGVTLVQGGTSLQTQFFSRGFELTSIQVDGGAPMATSMATSTGDQTGFYPQIDMAQYDHVEILRGAAGLFNGYGNPSGTVNLVRKRPLNHAQVSVESQIGSWQTYRVVLDATAPLALDGALRGRAVLSYQDNEHFYDVAADNKTLAYGILEYDLTPSTLLTGGISFARQDSVPWSGGLPRYQNGDDLKLARHTCLCFSWNRWDFDTTELFATVQQQLGEAWTMKLNLTRNRQESARKVGFSSGTVNPITGAGPSLGGDMFDFASDQVSAELTLSGSVTVFGQLQEVVVGLNHATTDAGGRTDYTSLVSNSTANPYIAYPGGPTGIPPINVFAFNAFDSRYTEPRNALGSRRYQTFGQAQSLAYINLNLSAFDRWHLITGLRYSRYELEDVHESLCTNVSQQGCAGKPMGEPAGAPAINPSGKSWDDRDMSWPPSVSLVFDVTSEVSAYVGYADIYESQASLLDRDLNPLDPVTGANVEVGLKWANAQNTLNAGLAAYRIERKNFAAADLNAFVVENGVSYFIDNKGNRYVSGVLADQRTCCFVDNPNRTILSQGVDLELTGQILPGLQIFAGYTWNKNEQQGSFFGANDGQPFTTRQPEHLLKLWTSYALGGDGWTNRLTIGAGVNAQSDAYNAGSACIELNPPNAQGTSTCRTSAPYEYTQDAYAVWSARLDYQLSDSWIVALNVENIADERYYQTMGSSTSGNWYGEPRSFALTVRGKW